MTKYILFMITLISLHSCQTETNRPKLTPEDRSTSDKIIADYESPVYKWGYLNKNGELEIADKYDELREFSEGRAAYNLRGLWGYLDKTGIQITAPQFITADAYNNGIAVAKNLNGTYCLLDRSGTIITDSLIYDTIEKFHDGLAVVQKSTRYGYIDVSGTLKIPMEYTYASKFTDGKAIVALNDNQGLIDKIGKELIAYNYDKLWPTASGMIRYKLQEKYGYINADTRKPLSRTFDSATDFQGDYAVVSDKGDYLLMQRSGVSKPLSYDYIDTGGEGKWMYTSDAKYGFLNNDGSILTAPHYDLVMRYREGRAGFAMEDKWGYLDETGSIIVQPTFPLVWDFHQGFARMIGRTGFGFIDRSGVQIFPPRYMEVRDFSEGLARIQVYR